MSRGLKSDTDTLTISEFGEHPAESIKRLKSSWRPLVLTQRGESAAVLLDVTDYERMVEEIELLSDIRTALEQVADGQAVDNESAKSFLRGRFGA